MSFIKPLKYQIPTNYSNKKCVSLSQRKNINHQDKLKKIWSGSWLQRMNNVKKQCSVT